MPATSRRTWRQRLRRTLLSWHLYGGLLCSSYLVIYGVSSLHFNHRFSFTEGVRETVAWRGVVDVPTAATDPELALEVRDALGLFGWVAQGMLERRDDGTLFIVLDRPGKNYRIAYDPASGGVEVEERRFRTWRIIDLLHGGGRVPGSTLMTGWWLYTLFSWVVVLFSAVTGIYLWWVSKRDRVLGWPMVWGGGAVFLAFLLFLVW